MRIIRPSCFDWKRDGNPAGVGLRWAMLCLTLLPAWSLSLADQPQPRQPNFLFIMADDCTYNVLGCYGGQNVATPNIDRLAAEGLKFNHAYVAMSMCVPCRHELYTGLYPLDNGACWNHSRAIPGTKGVCHWLGDLGYRVGIAGKVHLGPPASFPFVMVPGFERNCVARTADYNCDGIRGFMSSDDRQPFCLFVCSTNPHEPWTVGDASRFDQKKLRLPPVLGDTAEMRKCYADYLAEVAELDRQVGDILKTLDECGRARDTLVMFSSEQGWQFAGAKWTNWDLGMHTALLARWPGRVAPGTTTDALVQFADVVPTLVDAAGGSPAALGLDGTSFLGVLLGKRNEHRKYVYGLHNNVPEGPPYPIRMIRSKDFHYIWNLTPKAQYIEKHIEMPDISPWWMAWKEAAKTDAHARQMMDRFYYRPAEELYKTNEDPYELKNLADDPAYAEVKAELRGELEWWLRSQNDPGVALDTEAAWQANKKKPPAQRGNRAAAGKQ